MSEENKEVVENKEVEPKKKKKKKSKVRVILEWTFTIIFAGLFVFFAIGQVTGMINKSKNYGQTLTYGYGTFVIQTNSMEPVYPVGTAIITHKESAESMVKSFDAGKIVDVTFYCSYVSNNYKYDYPLYRPGNISYGGIDYKLSGHEPVYPTSATPVITHRVIGYYMDESRSLGTGRYTFVVAGINIQDGEYSKEGQYQLLTENELLGVVKVNSPVLGGIFRFITSPWGLLVFLLIPAFYLVITSVIDIFRALKESEDEPKPVPSGGGSGPSSIEGLSEADKERLKKEMLDEMLNKKGK